MRVGAEIPRGTVPALCGKKRFTERAFLPDRTHPGDFRAAKRVRLSGLSVEAKRRNARSVISETERTEPEGF